MGEHHRPPDGHPADGHAVPREDAAHPVEPNSDRHADAVPRLTVGHRRRTDGQNTRAGGPDTVRNPLSRSAAPLPCPAVPLPAPSPIAERGVHMTAAAVRTTGTIPVPRSPLSDRRPAQPAGRRRRPSAAARSPTSGCCTSSSAASGGCSASSPPGRRAGEAGAHRDADPARRPDRPRPAAPPRGRARRRLAGPAPRGARRPDAPPSAPRSTTGPAAAPGSTTCCATSRPPPASGRSTGTAPARDAFALACLDLADAVDAQTAEEEAVLLPLLAEHLSAGDWAVDRPVVALPALRPRAAARARPGARGLLRRRPRPAAQRRSRPRRGWPGGCTAAQDYRAAVVRLRGAPPAV